MYEYKSIFLQPTNADEKVWRYMDFSKFVSLLHTRGLFFTRLDRFADPFEGSSPDFWVNQRERMLAQIREDPQYTDEKRAEILASYADVPETLAALRRTVAANCWHLNPDESMAMWKLYLSSRDGVAIQTTYRRLLESFSQTTEPINVGCISYIDYRNDSINTNSIDALYMHKLNSFQHEREVRCIIHRYPENWRDTPLIEHGYLVPVDLDLLIENIYVAPTSEPWFMNVVNETARRFWKDLKVRRSALDGTPKY